MKYTIIATTLFAACFGCTQSQVPDKSFFYLQPSGLKNKNTITPSQPLPKWRSDYSVFTARINSVEIGWTVKQLLEYAGEPNCLNDELYFYDYEGNTGFFSLFTFQINNGIITDIYYHEGDHSGLRDQ